MKCDFLPAKNPVTNLPVSSALVCCCSLCVCLCFSWDPWTADSGQVLREDRRIVPLPQRTRCRRGLALRASFQTRGRAGNPTVMVLWFKCTGSYALYEELCSITFEHITQYFAVGFLQITKMETPLLNKQSESESHEPQLSGANNVRIHTSKLLTVLSSGFENYIVGLLRILTGNEHYTFRVYQ